MYPLVVPALPRERDPVLVHQRIPPWTRRILSREDRKDNCQGPEFFFSKFWGKFDPFSRLAISPCALNSATNAGSQREGSAHLGAEHLSPVDERRAAGIRGGGGVPKRMEKRPSAVVHELVKINNEQYI